MRNNFGKILASSLALVSFEACFTGEFAQGLPCVSDGDCGPQLQCQEGLCGGAGDPTLCGNGLLDIGEECDDSNLRDGDTCTPSCRFPICGDGYAAVGEACDDGNTEDGDSCTSSCQLPPIPPMCGNGNVESGEECDDGNLNDGDACTPQCLLPTCGDGFLAGGEECDDGNDIGTDACTPQCLLPVCGDGYVNAGEVCDDGNDIETDACLNKCLLSPEAPTLEMNLARVKQFEFSWTPVLGAEWYELFERVEPGDDYQQIGGMIEDLSYSLTVPLHFRVNASYQLRACNAFRCVDSAEYHVSGTLSRAVGYFKASNTEERDHFGSSLALSADGTTLAVGAYSEQSGATGINGDQQDNSAQDAGAVYVFTKVSETWEQQAYVKASNAEGDDFFGATKLSLSADGNTLAVGAWREDSGTTGIDGNQQDNSAMWSGAVYVFARTGDTWAQQAYVKASNTDEEDYFGYAFDLSGDGDTLAVGATYEGSGATGINGDQGNTLPSAGAVYVFTRTGGAWSQQAYIKASNTGFGDRFGDKMELSGNGDTLVVGAPYEDSGAAGINSDQSDDSANNAGAAYVFVRANDTWSQQAYLKASNADEGDLFGLSLALSEDGDTLAIGAPHEESGATGVDGDQNDNSVPTSGAVYMFTRTGEQWTQQAYLKASNTEQPDRFGSELALSADGTILGVTAEFEDSNATGINGDQSDNSAQSAGAAYLFTQADGSWQQHAYIKASVSGMNYAYGAAIAMSGDGEIIAVSAPGESSADVGIGGQDFDDSAPESGAVNVY